MPGVKAVITGKDLEAAGLGWLPTFHGFDKQMVLAIGKVLFQYQEVAAVFAETRAAAVDGAESGAGRLRAAAGRRRSVHLEDRQGAAAAGPREQDEPHLPLGSRRQGRHRSRDGVEPEADQAAHLVPALSSRAARAVRLRRVLRHDGAAAVPRDVAGAARLSHGAVARHRHSRGQDPCDVAGSRRRLRQQGAGLSRIRVRDRRRAQDRTAGQVDRDAHGEPHEHRLRPRLPHGRGDRRDRRRQGHRAARRDDGRSRRVRCGGRSEQVPGGHLRHRHRQLQLPGRPRRGRRVLHEQGAGRHRLPLLVPRHRSELRDRARHGHPGRRAGHGCRGAAQEELHPEGSVPVPVGAGVHLRQRRLSQDARRRAREDRLHRAAEGAGGEARARRADGHRLLDVHRGGGRRAVEALRHPRHQDVRQRRDPHPSDRRRHRAHGHQVAGPGARNDVGAGRRRGAGARSADHHGRGRRHRHGAVRPRHATRAAARRSPAPPS